MRWSWLILGLLAGCRDDAIVHPAQSSEPSIPASSPPVAEAPPDDAGAPDASDARPALPLGACAGPPGITYRVLIVGNSQIYYWELPKLLSDLSASGPPECPRIAAEGFTRGGQNLERLWKGGDSLGRNLATVIAEGKYDFVVISESIDLIEQPPPKTPFHTHANLIIDAARAAGSAPVLYATPYADQEGHHGFVEMAEPQLALGKAREVPVAAGGLAWLRVWEVFPDLDLHHTDHAHPGYKGSVISAMVIYSVITHATPLALDPKQSRQCAGSPCAVPTADEATVFQEAAWTEAQATGM